MAKEYHREDLLLNNNMIFPIASLISSGQISIRQSPDINTGKTPTLNRNCTLLNKIFVNNFKCATKRTLQRRFNCLEEDSGLMISVDATGGTCKTFVNNLILAQVRRDREVATAIKS